MISKVQPKVLADKYDKYKMDSANRLELERLRGQLSIERASFWSHWQMLGRVFFPRRTRFYTTDVNRGNPRNTAIINSTGGLAARTLRSGMMASFTSRARQWFTLETFDPDLMKRPAVQEWCYDCTWRLSDIFQRSNIYTSLQTTYGDMGVFGTAALLIEEDMDKVINTLPVVIGSYYIFANDKLNIDGFMRDFRLTVRQIVEKFCMDEETGKIDWTNASAHVKNLWEAGTTEAWMEITHAIVPNPDWKPDRKESKYKKFMSTYYERGTTQGQATLSELDSMKVLSRKGFDRFPVLVPRWEVSGEDIYGTYCPGMEALGDQEGLQTYERRKAQALEKSINPPMTGPSSLRTAKATVLPGDITFVDGMAGSPKFEPAYMIQPNFQQVELVMSKIEERIDKCFHKDLWLAISNLDKANVTAEEIRALKEEKLQEIGPVMDRLNGDLLDPLVEQTFAIANKQRLLPPPPPELRGQSIRIKYSSIISMAQKALGASTIERFVAFYTSVKNSEPENPDIVDAIDTDKLITRYNEDISLPPGIIRSPEDIAKIRQQKQQAQQKQQQLAAAESASKSAKNLAGAPTDGQNALTDLLANGNAGNLLPT